MKKENLFISEYNKANRINIKSDLDIYDECSFSYLDIISESGVEITSKTYGDCKCVSSVNFNTYYYKCEKCSGTGKLELNGNEVVCNHCRGKKAIVKEICPLCKGETKIVKTSKIKVKLNKNIKEGDVITLVNKGKESNGVFGNLYIKVKVSDLENFEIKGHDVYDKRMIEFNKEEISKGISKIVKTVKGTVSVVSSGIEKEEVVKLNGQGIDDGDYYICLNNELTPIRGEDVYKNVIINKNELCFYIDKAELYSDKKCLSVYYYKKVNSDYEYIELENINDFKVVKLKGKGKVGKNGGANGDLYLRVYFEDFYNIDDTVYYKPIVLNKYELMDGKKTIEFNKEKVNLSFEKNLVGDKVLEVKNLGFIIDKNEFDSCYFTVSDKEIYKVSIDVKKKDKVVYLKDYKKYFYEKVKVNYDDGLKVVLGKDKEVIVNDVIVKINRIGG